jgi:hypothetical protein
MELEAGSHTPERRRQENDFAPQGKMTEWYTAAVVSSAQRPLRFELTPGKTNLSFVAD